jgi:hypothetical protein
MTPFAAQLPSGVTARPLNDRDLAAALTLSAEAGWNQTAADWQIFLDLGSAVGVVGTDGRVIATAATLPHANRFAWISMVLVTPRNGERGLPAGCCGTASNGSRAVSWCRCSMPRRPAAASTAGSASTTPGARGAWSAWSGQRRRRRGRGRRQRASRYAGSTLRIGPKSSPSLAGRLAAHAWIHRRAAADANGLRHKRRLRRLPRA